ncbi:hypothetical protein [Prosthecobacter dejongeii]|nr:hypothetical protein [Prosthecobacter dejongeii]
MQKMIPLWVRLSLLVLFGLLHAVSSQAGVLDRKPDYSQHDVPLYEQVTNRIKAKILARLGNGNNPRDRYFIIPFAYQNQGNAPEYSHSFMSVIRVLADRQQRHLTEGLTRGVYKNREFEAFTISWLPHDFDTNPNLCVFKGFGSRLFPRMNACPLSPGKSFNLEQTLRLAVNVKNAVCMWGPYEITQGGFDLGVQRLRLLESGRILYRADDRLYRKDRVAINCFHAMAGLYDLYPNGGIFGTGFKMWGINGTARVLLEYENTASFRGQLLEPVDEKKDRYGFIYSAQPHSRPYNPFKEASAYRR